METLRGPPRSRGWRSMVLKSADMALYAAAARRRLGELLAGDEGRQLIDYSAAWMTKQGIKNPAAVSNLMAPGF
jgi:hypothetical protein